MEKKIKCKKARSDLIIIEGCQNMTIYKYKNIFNAKMKMNEMKNIK